MKYFSFIIILFACSSCDDFFDTVVDIDPPEHEPGLAVHAFGSNKNEGELKLMLTKTYGILEDQEREFINDASITLQSEGQIFSFEELSQPYFNDTLVLSDTTIIFHQEYHEFNLISRDFRAVPGQKYILSIDYPTLPSIRAEQTYPHPVVPDSVIFVQNAGIDQNGDPVSAIDIYFQDPPGVENFYEIKVRSIDREFTHYEYIMSSEPGALMSEQSISYTDKVFDGEHKRLRVTFYNYNENPGGQDHIVYWTTISPETYAFNKAVNRYLESVDNPFLTPTQLFTNIENGVGIFSLSHQMILEPR